MERTHQTNNKCGELYDTYGLCVCATAQPRRLIPNDGDHPRESVWKRKVLKNQALFRRCTAVYRAIKNQIFTAVQALLPPPLLEKLTGIGQVTALQMLQHPFNFYGAICEIGLEKNAVKTMGPYKPAEPLYQLTEKIEKR